VEHTRKNEKVTVVSEKKLPIHHPAIKSKKEGIVVICAFSLREKTKSES
jgi:hypothetical protein